MTRATDLPVEARAFLDALAVGESGGADDDAAYSILYGGAHFIVSGTGPQQVAVLPKADGFHLKVYHWPNEFPQWPGIWLHGVPTHAAGRYQFEPATWRDVAGRHRLPDFSPVSQDHAAWLLATDVYGRWVSRPDDIPLLNDLRTGDASHIAGRLHTTWTSLSDATFPTRYRAALAKLTA